MSEAGPWSRVIYFTACTLDGFIADEHHSFDWLFEVPHTEDDGSWDEFIGDVGALVVGTSTYLWMVERHADPAGRDARGPGERRDQDP